MMVLNEICKECNYICNVKHFQYNFGNWTRGNNVINKLIQNIQLSTHNNASEVLEWIPYNRFYDIKCIAKGKVYRANWIDGYIKSWDDENQSWNRYNKNMFIYLKSLNGSKNITLEFMNKV